MVVHSAAGAPTGGAVTNPPVGAPAALQSASRDIISLPNTIGDGDLLYHEDAAPNPAADTAPAWSTTGKFIAFFRSTADGAGQLVLFDCDTQELRPLLKPAALRGRLAFGEETIVIEGADAATILWPHISHQREVVERF
jgi:hypothetical protein